MNNTKVILIFSIALLLLVASCKLPKIVKEFRDNPEFYKTVRGYKDPKNVLPNEANIDKLISENDPIYQKYLRELYSGFIKESHGQLKEAQIFYLKCLDINIHEEQNYYKI